MKKLFTLLTMLILCIGSMWAVDVTWESIHGWTQSSGGVGNFKWYGVHTPGDNTITFNLTSIQLQQNSGNNNTNYLAIASSSPGANTTIAASNVLGVSTNSIKAEANTLYEYTFSSSGINLTGGTTYYLVFVSSNSADGSGNYTIQEGRMSVNHVGYDKKFNYGAYSYGNNANVNWWPYFKATLTTSAAITNYNYSCKNLAGYEFCSGTLPQASAPTQDQAPKNIKDNYSYQSISIDGTDVVYSYALTSNPLASATTPSSEIATNPKYITIESTAGNFVYYAEEGGAVKGWKEDEHSKDADDAHWIIVGDETNGYKLYNALTGTSKVAVVADENGAAIQMKDEASNTASLFDIRYISDAYRLYKKGTEWCTNRLSSNTRVMGIHENVNDGSKTTVTRYSKTVTYKLKWNNSEITSQNVSVPTGDDPADYLPSEWNRAYCNYTCDVSYVTTETSTVNVTMNWNGPFDISSDFNSAKWYYLKFGDLWVSYAEGEDHEASTSNSQSTTSESMWAFLGNPKDGIKIVNRKKGDGYYLEFDGYAKMKASGYINITIEENGDNTYANVGDGYYAASFVDGLGIRTGYDEDRCIMTVEAAPYKDQALAYLTEYAASHHMGEYFEVDESSYNGLVTMTTSLGSMTENEYNDLVSNINNYLSPKLPETGYYRIKSSGSRGDQSYITYGYLDGAKGTGLLTTIGNKETDLGTVVKLTRVHTSKNYKISIQGLNVQAHSGDNNLFRATGAEGQNFQFNHINFSGMCSIYDGKDHGNMHEAGWKKPDTGLNGVVGWTAGDGTNASSWSVEDATACTVTLNSDGATTPTYYATLCVPFDVTISDATAYTLAKSESGNYLVPTEVTDNKVPAGTPVLLKGTNATATATINTGSAFNDGSPLDCALTGIYVTTSVDATTNYVFGKFNGKVGFYHVDNEEFSLKANRAYLKASVSGARGFSLMFDDDVTGIVSTPGETEEGTTIYNLSGQRLNKIQKGINIVNGKKVLF